jgi:hypothetical protein
LKLRQTTLKGGIFFLKNQNSSTYTYYTLVNTRSPTSPFFLSNIAA